MSQSPCETGLLVSISSCRKLVLGIICFVIIEVPSTNYQHWTSLTWWFLAPLWAKTAFFINWQHLENRTLDSLWVHSALFIWMPSHHQRGDSKAFSFGKVDRSMCFRKLWIFRSLRLLFHCYMTDGWWLHVVVFQNTSSPPVVSSFLFPSSGRHELKMLHIANQLLLLVLN